MENRAKASAIRRARLVSKSQSIKGRGEMRRFIKSLDVSELSKSDIRKVGIIEDFLGRFNRYGNITLKQWEFMTEVFQELKVSTKTRFEGEVDLCAGRLLDLIEGMRSK
ncbi:MAG: hypothetical protein Unbinned8472contig1000_21 [Prokaryotic dsDNA virus sp.]|nr:MAG: hypothetical protein Unbinned8472contig1000_21 [Prokaryotic dsDNA virus sp.]|tara:strand:- start:6063 stop:6389 length:327 start_codon:yes stop_codon:yes gene_type:complete